jgi:hypothetical protein
MIKFLFLVLSFGTLVSCGHGKIELPKEVNSELNQIFIPSFLKSEIGDTVSINSDSTVNLVKQNDFYLVEVK